MVQVRGAEQRNEAIRLLRNLVLNETDPVLQAQYKVREDRFAERTRAFLTESCQEGVVYFADDDNAYHIDVFKELRKVKRIGVFPVTPQSARLDLCHGMTVAVRHVQVGAMQDGAEHCTVNKTTGKVDGFHAWNLVCRRRRGGRAVSVCDSGREKVLILCCNLPRPLHITILRPLQIVICNGRRERAVVRGPKAVWSPAYCARYK